MIHKNKVKSSVNLFIVAILFTSLIFIIDAVNAEETTEMGLVLSSETVSVGDEFVVTVYINPTEEIGGWQIYQLSFMQGKANAINVSPGSYWGTNFDPGDIDNDTGIITNIQTYDQGPYPDMNHTACTINFTALQPGEFTIEVVSVEVTNDSFITLPVTTHTVTITIIGDGNEDNGDNGGNGGNGGHTEPNTPPVANASASETTGFIGIYIQFNGSLSYDPDDDGYIESWHWDFGDGETGEEETTEHNYHEADSYTVTLTVTDNKGATDTDVINVNITQGPNIPPEKPVVNGPLTGHMNAPYNYTANSTDLDNDTISYIFNWGDGNIFKTEFLSINKSTTQTHIWSTAGRYIVSVEVTDNQTYSQSTELTMMIDALDVGDIGYLTDDDGDETYDTFHNDATGDLTDLGQDANGSYLIDSDGDGEWEYIYNSDTGVLEEYVTDTSDDEKSTPSLGFIGVISVILFFVVIKKKQLPKKPV